MLVPGRGAAFASRGVLRGAIPGALAALCLLSIGAVALDCGLVIGAGEYAVDSSCPSGDCALCGNFTYAQAACGACLDTSCCAEAEACRKSAPCAALFDCYAACTAADHGCVSACDQKHAPDGGADAAAAALATCEATSCVADCPTCGGLVDWYAPGCSACVATTCCAGASACAGDVVCAELEECYRTCDYPSCPIDCQSRIAASSGQPIDGPIVTELDTCTSHGCRTECAYGAHWGCVGSFSWPAPTPGATVELTVQATTFESNGVAPFPGALIRACGRPDVDCSSPLTHGTTLADGTVTLTLPSGFDGYLDATAPDTFESLAYQAWPLTMATSTYPIELGPYALYKSLVMSGGGTVDDALGALFVFTRDCQGAPAPGVSLSIVPFDKVNTFPFYFINGSPIGDENMTTTDAIGGFANVTPGVVALTATYGPHAESIASFTVQVRPETITYVTLTPTQQ